MKLPEVLAPAGGPDCLPAAVAGGADAVFLGLRHFNARGRAENFRTADLGRHVDYLHGHGLKCYVVLNTLVHDDEHPKALTLARAAADAGVDAAIIQDLGLWRLLAKHVPQLKRHGSTQMTVHDPSQIRALAALGAERVILARELSLAEILACTKAAKEVDVETEHFVHGALCYAFSGQCLMSNFAGCRSANRGTCAQNCRFDYQRSDKNGAEAETEISMRDLNLVERVGELARAGVASFKIEGRLKGPDYVYTVSRAYRQAVDAWKAGRPLATAEKDRLRDVFARPHTAAPLDGDYSAKSRLHRWQPATDQVADAVIDTCDRMKGEAILTGKGIHAGQGFAFTIGTGEDAWNGGFLVTAADALGGNRFKVKLRLPDKGPRIPPGTKLFRNADHARKAEANTAMAAVPLPPATPDTTPLVIAVSGRPGQPLTITGTAPDGRTATITGDVLQVPRGAPLDGERLADALGSLGGTVWRLDRLAIDLPEPSFAPASVLKEQRRKLVAALDALPVPAPAEIPAEEDAFAPIEPGAPRRRDTAVWVVVSTPEAAAAVQAAGAGAVWYDDPTLDLWGAKAPVLPPGVWLRHPATAPVSPWLASLGHPVVAGHLGVLVAAQAADLPAVADVYCNTFSTATAAALGDLGAESVVVSLECSAREIARLAARAGESTEPLPKLAIFAGGRLPAMLTRQDHGLAVGGTTVLTAKEHDGGLSYELARRKHDTVIWEGRRLCAPAALVLTAGLVDAWVLDLADLPAADAAQVTRGYVGLIDALRPGTLDAEAVEDLTDALSDLHSILCPLGTFPGHLEKGSRELDAVAGRLTG